MNPGGQLLKYLAVSTKTHITRSTNSSTSSTIATKTHQLPIRIATMEDTTTTSPSGRRLKSRILSRILSDRDGEESPDTVNKRRSGRTPRAGKLPSLFRLGSSSPLPSGSRDTVFEPRSWRTPRAGKVPSLLRLGSSSPPPLPEPVLPATLIAPPTEKECFVKKAIENEMDGIDSKRLFKALVAIENLEP